MAAARLTAARAAPSRLRSENLGGIMVALKEGQAVWVKDPAIAKDNLYNIGSQA